MKKSKENLRGSVSEAIIVVQSLLLVLLAVAGIASTDAVTAGFNALTNAQSAMYIITDNAIVTETEQISVERVQSIIQNYELINACILTIGLIVFVATLIRIFKKK
jgi:hypothetical protein